MQSEQAELKFVQEKKHNLKVRALILYPESSKKRRNFNTSLHSLFSPWNKTMLYAAKRSCACSNPSVCIHWMDGTSISADTSCSEGCQVFQMKMVQKPMQMATFEYPSEHIQNAAFDNNVCQSFRSQMEVNLQAVCWNLLKQRNYVSEFSPQSWDGLLQKLLPNNSGNTTLAGWYLAVSGMQTTTSQTSAPLDFSFWSWFLLDPRVSCPKMLCPTLKCCTPWNSVLPPRSCCFCTLHVDLALNPVILCPMWIFCPQPEMWLAGA